MTKNLFPHVLAAVLFTICFNYIAYFGFTTNYTKNVFSKETFSEQYNKGIYRYRILSNYLLIKTNDLLSPKEQQTGSSPRILGQDSKGNDSFYLAYFLLNTVFLSLAAACLVILLHTGTILQVTKNEKILLSWLLLSILCFSQFVITPYDASSYFLQILIMLIFFTFYKTYRVISLAILCPLIFLYTLNRESVALSLAFLALIIWLQDGFKKAFLPVLALGLSFLAAYLSLRLFMEGSARTFEDIRLKHNLVHFPNIIGIICWILFFYLSMVLSREKGNRFLIIAYHVLCLPYIVVCIATGILFELRLYIPILISTVILANMSTQYFKYPPTVFRSLKQLLKTA